jgi:hypothetical protein
MTLRRRHEPTIEQRTAFANSVISERVRSLGGARSANSGSKDDNFEQLFSDLFVSAGERTIIGDFTSTTRSMKACACHCPR